jgi:hypothetical protein
LERWAYAIRPYVRSVNVARCECVLRIKNHGTLIIKESETRLLTRETLDRWFIDAWIPSPGKEGGKDNPSYGGVGIKAPPGQKVIV